MLFVEQMAYSIKIQEIKMVRQDEYDSTDSESRKCYVVSGTGENRQLLMLRLGGMENTRSDNMIINEICDEIERVSSMTWVEEWYIEEINDKIMQQLEEEESN